MLPRRMRWLWGLLTLAAFLTGLVEGGAAAAVFALIKIITDPSQIGRIPVASTIVKALPWQSPRSQLLVLTGMVALYYLFKNLLVVATQYLRHKIVGESATALKGTILKGYLAAPYHTISRRNSAELIWNISSAVDKVCVDVLSSAVSIASEVLTAASITIVLLLAAPRLTLIAGSLLIAVLALVLRLTRRTVERLGGEREELSKASLRTIQESLGGIKEIKALGREEFFQRRFENVQQGILRLGYLEQTFVNSTPFLTETIFLCGALLVVALVIGKGGTQAEGLPILALFSYSAFRIVPSANRVAWRMNQIRAALRAADSLYSDFSLISEGGAVYRNRSEATTTFRDRLEVERVSYAYPGTETAVLRDVSLTIRSGESIGIVGPTGAGKTTLIDLIVGLLHPLSGRILVDGNDIKERISSWKHHIGYVPQAIFLTDDNLTRNIALGLADFDIDEQRVQTAVRLAQLEPFVASLPNGLNTIVGERGARLSGGERQRVGIARALYHDPELLVFDEATSALDNATEAEIAKSIEALRGQKTLLVIAHRLTTVRECDRLYFISGGRVVASGSYDELMKDNAEFRRMVAAADNRQNPNSN